MYLCLLLRSGTVLFSKLKKVTARMVCEILKLNNKFGNAGRGVGIVCFSGCNSTLISLLLRF